MPHTVLPHVHRDGTQSNYQSRQRLPRSMSRETRTPRRTLAFCTALSGDLSHRLIPWRE